MQSMLLTFCHLPLPSPPLHRFYSLFTNPSLPFISNPTSASPLTSFPRAVIQMASPRPVSIHDCLLPKSGLRVRIFYPCTASTSSSPASWFPSSATFFPNENAVALADYLRLPYLLTPLISTFLSASLPFACDTPVAKGQYPLMLFSHGLGGSLAGYATFCAAVAATGRVVVATEHADGSAFAAYTGESRVRVPYTRIPEHMNAFQFRHEQLTQRVQELVAVLADIRAIAAGNAKQTALPGRGSSGKIENFAGAIAPPGEAVSVAGHSFGAGTALAFCHAVRRGDIRENVADAICLDPWLYPLGRKMVRECDIGDARVLFIDQERSGMNDSIALRRILPTPEGRGRYWSIKVQGGSHNNASDFATRLPRFVATTAGLTPKESDPELFMKAQNDAAVAFVEKVQWDSYWEDAKNGKISGISESVLPDAVALQHAL